MYRITLFQKQIVGYYKKLIDIFIGVQVLLNVLSAVVYSHMIEKMVRCFTIHQTTLNCPFPKRSSWCELKGDFGIFFSFQFTIQFKQTNAIYLDKTDPRIIFGLVNALILVSYSAAFSRQNVIHEMPLHQKRGIIAYDYIMSVGGKVITSGQWWSHHTFRPPYSLQKKKKNMKPC